MTENLTVVNRNTDRPLGVLLIALVVIVFGIIAAIVGLLSIATGFVVGIMGSPRGAGFAFIAGLGGLIIGALYVIAGIGLLNLRAWAWWLASIAGIIGIVVSFGSESFGWMFVWAVMVVYLFVVRAHFGTLPNVPRIVAA